MSLQTYIDDAIEELEKDHLADATLDDVEAIEDCICELADSNTPIYYSDMLECVSDDISLFITRPDNAGPEDTPDKLIQLNIYERIESALWERFREWQEEQEEIELEADPED